MQALSFQVPLVLGFVTALALVGSFRLNDVVSMQGGLPDEWLIFRSPWTWVSFGVFIACLLPQAAAADRRAPEAAHPLRQRRAAIFAPLAAIATLSQWLNLWLAAGLGSAVFLGGWSLPSPMQVGGLTESVLGAAVFQFKIWVLVVALTVLRWLLQDFRFQDALPIAYKALMPLALCCALGSLVWARAASMEIFRVSQPWLSSALAIGTLVASLWGIVRVVGILKATSLPGQINPWL